MTTPPSKNPEVNANVVSGTSATISKAASNQNPLPEAPAPTAQVLESAKSAH